ncbi:MAG: Gx transporter family protein [Thomasclavelia sp.]|nr:Gx transporter family protein [Thomasclavelia sp.]
MKITKTQKIVLAAMLAALGVIINLIEIPYPFAPWLNLDLSEIVVLIAVSTLGLPSAVFVCICKFFVSILFKGPVGPIAIGQITALIASLSICFTYYFLSKKVFKEDNLKNYCINMLITMFVFAMIMFIINYLFVTPTYLMQKPTWYTDMPFNVDINAFNKQYGSNISIPSFLGFLSGYGQAIFIIYFPFNFIKGIITAIVYYFVRPVEKKLISMSE